MKTTTNTLTEPAQEIPAPTKEQEIAILREASRLLGPLSYCGPWLAQQLGEIERDIRSDYYPCIDIDACKTRCGEMLTVANDRAAEIVAAAERTAKATLARGEKQADDVRNAVASAVANAQRAIQRW